MSCTIYHKASPDVDITNYVVNDIDFPIRERGRDYSLSLTPFTMDVSFDYTTDLTGEDIEILIDGDRKLLVYGLSSVKNWNKKVYEVKCINVLAKTRDIVFKRSEMKDYLEVAADFTGANIAYIDSDDNIITTGTEFSVGNTIQFQVGETPATFQAGALPGTITMTNYMQFVITSKTVNGGGWDYKLSYIGLPVNFITTGTLASHKIALVDVDLFNFYDNRYSKNVSMKHLFTSIIERLGYTLDTSQIDTIIYNPYYYNTTWINIVFDLNMLYAVNQQYAYDVEAFEDANNVSLDINKISLFDLLSELCSILACTLEYVSENGFRVMPGTRVSNGFAYKILYNFCPSIPDDTSTYSIDENYNYSPKEYTITKEDANYDVSDISFNSDPLKYTNTTEDALDGVISQTYYVAGIGTCKLTTIRGAWNNFVLMTRTVNVGFNPGTCSSPNTDLMLIAAAAKVRAKIYDWSVEEIETSWTDTIQTIKENFYNLRTRTSKIIQETIIT